MDLSWIFEPRYPVFGHTVSVAGIAALVASLALGLLVSTLIQRENTRAFFCRRGLDKIFVSVATSLLGLAIIVISLITGLNFAGLPVDSETAVPGLGISAGRLLRLALLLVAVFWLCSSFKRFLFNRYLSKMGLDRALQYAIAQISGYVILAIGVLVVVQNAGIDLSALAVFAGAVGVGIGLGLQSLTNNFICGLIVLAERPIRIGDRIEVNEIAGQVTAIRARSTTVTTNDNIAIIVPNSEIIENPVINWTFNDPKVRIRVKVEVGYGSNAGQVRDLLLQVARDNSAVLEDPPPVVFFDSFGESGLNFELGVWTAEMSSRPRRFRSDLNFAIEKALREAGIEIPLPQRDVRIRMMPRIDEPRMETE